MSQKFYLRHIRSLFSKHLVLIFISCGAFNVEKTFSQQLIDESQEIKDYEGALKAFEKRCFEIREEYKDAPSILSHQLHLEFEKFYEQYPAFQAYHSLLEPTMYDTHVTNQQNVEKYGEVMNLYIRDMHLKEKEEMPIGTEGADEEIDAFKVAETQVEGNSKSVKQQKAQNYVDDLQPEFEPQDQKESEREERRVAEIKEQQKQEEQLTIAKKEQDPIVVDKIQGDSTHHKKHHHKHHHQSLNKLQLLNRNNAYRYRSSPLYTIYATGGVGIYGFSGDIGVAYKIDPRGKIMLGPMVGYQPNVQNDPVVMFGLWGVYRFPKLSFAMGGMVNTNPNLNEAVGGPTDGANANTTTEWEQYVNRATMKLNLDVRYKLTEVLTRNSGFEVDLIGGVNFMKSVMTPDQLGSLLVMYPTEQVSYHVNGISYGFYVGVGLVQTLSRKSLGYRTR